MKHLLTISCLTAFSSLSYAKSVSCFSRYYGANSYTISISGDIASDTTLTNVSVRDDGDGFLANITSTSSFDGKHRASGPYANYQDFKLLNDNKDRYALRSIILLLPKELTELSGQFNGYASDPNADGSGSSGYQRLLCRIR